LCTGRYNQDKTTSWPDAIHWCRRLLPKNVGRGGSSRISQGPWPACAHHHASVWNHIIDFRGTSAVAAAHETGPSAVLAGGLRHHSAITIERDGCQIGAQVRARPGSCLNKPAVCVWSGKKKRPRGVFFVIIKNIRRKKKILLLLLHGNTSDPMSDTNTSSFF